MRVIHVVPAITEEASGPSYSVVRMCESLIAQGQEVTLAALDWAPMLSPPPFLKVFPLGVGPRRLGRSPAMRRWLVEQALSGNVDVLHNHGMWQMNAVYPGWATKKGKINLVVSPRGAFSKWAMQYGSRMKKVFWPLVQRPALEYTTCFHATAESEYEDIRRMGFMQPVAVIPNGINIPEMPPKTATGFRTLLFIGRIHSVKGLDMLLPAWRAVQDRFPEWRLVIAGSDDGYYGNSGYLGDMHALAQQLHLKRIEFVGELRGHKKLKAYQEADLYILPSYSENFGMTVAEALAAGMPAIVSKGAPWRGLETHGAGWWIDIGVEPLVACLEDALTYSQAALADMGLRGRGWMEAEFSWAHLGQRMAETYNWLIGNRTAAPDWVHVD